MTIHRSILDSMARLYDLPPLELKPVAGGHASHVYEYRDGPRRQILKIMPPNPEIDLHAMRSMFEWMAFLAAHGGPVARPIRSRHGNLIEELEHKGQSYLITAYEKAPGVLAEKMSFADWNDEIFQLLGRSVGHCHRVAQEYVPALEEYRRPEWDCEDNCFNPLRDLVDADRIILEQRAKVLDVIRALPKDPEGYGLAHLDLHFGNFFVDAERQKIVLLDFEDCAYGWYIMDIAMLLFDVLVVYDRPDRGQFAERFLLNLLIGYSSQKLIDPFWIDQLPGFLKLLEIGVYAMIYRTYEPATAGEWGRKFMSERRERIEQNVPYVDLDFQALYNRAIS